MSDEVEEIKRRIDIVDLISSYLTLKKAGVNYRALCPFHNEKTPSLMVSPEKQIWHCFGCGQGSDIFGFVMKMENLEFPEALRMLADRAGIQLKRRDSSTVFKKSQDNKSRLYLVNSFAAKAFHKILVSHPAGRTALNYLKKRKLTDQTIKEFMLGYAPSSRAMNLLLKKRGFSDQEIKNAGSPDKFFKRIIFPITDVMANVIGFTGRVLDSNIQPKYLNTPETVIFHKGRILYNLARARGKIKLEKATVLVEGQMDVIASWQAGIKNVVATSGTALTPDHLQILYRYSPNLIFAFDADTAGLLAAKNGYEMAIAAGFNVKMVDLGGPPAGGFKDPGEMIEKKPTLWQKVVVETKPVIDWYFDLAFKAQKTSLTSQEKKEIAQEILPLIKKIPDTIEQAHYVGLLAKKLAVTENIIFDALQKIAVKGQKAREKPLAQKRKLSAGELLLGLLLKYPEKIDAAKKQIQLEDFQDEELATIYKEMIKQYDIIRLESGKKDFLEVLKLGLNRQLAVKVDELILIVDALGDDETILSEDLASSIQKLKLDKIERRKNYYAQEIKKAESARDMDRLKQLIKEFQDVLTQ